MHTLTSYATQRAKDSGRILVKVNSHVGLRRITKYFGESLEWFGPAALGSKTKLYFVPDTQENREYLSRQFSSVRAVV